LLRPQRHPTGRRVPNPLADEPPVRRNSIVFNRAYVYPLFRFYVRRRKS